METQKRQPLNRTISIAPMMDWTDRHERYFLRLITRRALLYTEMVTTGAIIHGDRDYLLKFDPFEHPVALQIGGSEPTKMGECAKIGADFGYDEININVGCPSDRVQSGRFGACLMAEPETIAACVAEMQRQTTIPVTVKTRIGIDELDSYEALSTFIRTVSDAGCRVFIIHARKAWLQGLSPKENREVPPLKYDVVYQVKRDFPDLEIIVNGGIQSVSDIKSHLQHVDGVMIGREAYQNPFFLAGIDQQFFQDDHRIPERAEIITQFLPYVEKQLVQGTHLKSITRHIMGLFQGQPGARTWRRYLSENAHKPGAGPEVILTAIKEMEQVREAVAERARLREAQKMASDVSLE